MTKSSNGGLCAVILILAQMVMLVMHYSGMVSGLPWWVVWFPGLIMLTWIGFIVFVIIVMLVIGILGAIFLR